MPVNLKGRSLLTLKDFTPDEIRYLLNLAADQQKWQAFRILLNRSSQDPMQENTESRKTEAAFPVRCA